MWNFLKTDSNKHFRINFTMQIFDKSDNDFRDVKVLTDSGCFNTLIPLWIAKDTSIYMSPPRADKVVVGGMSLPAQKCLIRQVQIEGTDEHGKVKIDSFDYVHMFAVDIPPGSELFDTILLGLNIMNNWHYAVYKNKNQLLIDSDPAHIPDFVPNKKFPYCNNFDVWGRYNFFQEGITGASINEDDIQATNSNVQADTVISPPPNKPDGSNSFRVLTLYFEGNTPYEISKELNIPEYIIREYLEKPNVAVCLKKNNKYP